MPLRAPNLDDRTFQQLINDARTQVEKLCPEWTDLTPSDPGMVMLELFAHLTDTMIYRLNRLPEKAYIEFLRLIGLRLHAPAAARTTLVFSRNKPGSRELKIPRGTRVAVTRPVAGGQAPTFVTLEDAVIPGSGSSASVLAYHCELVDAEIIGIGSGLPGQSYSVRKAPISAPEGDATDLVIAVEASADELEEGVGAREADGKAFRVWREVPNFANVHEDPHAYVVDRLAGTITFAPAVRLPDEEGLDEAPRALADVPPAGAQIRAWYRSGGGADGNVAANSLTTLKDQVAGLEVTNPEPATGGRSEETLENALMRGPHELHTLQRAVTARDFELFANASGAVSRSKAYTRREVWAHATPGTVEVILVPELPEEARAGVDAGQLMSYQTEPARLDIKNVLDERRPMGTSCIVTWANYKSVGVKARVVVHQEENVGAVRDRVLKRLRETINPLPSQTSSGWAFGQDLQASHVYEIAVSEPGVRYADGVTLMVDDVPDRAVASIVADRFQGSTWFAASDQTVFRSMDAGAGWEPSARFAGERIKVVKVHGERAGCVAVATEVVGSGASRVHYSQDCGENWVAASEVAFSVSDIAWSLDEDGAPMLFLATDAGLYRLDLAGDTGPVPVLVDPADQGRAFYAIASVVIRGMPCIAVAAQNLGGVYLSTQGGRQDSFRKIGLEREDVRVLEVQTLGPRFFLWAGVAASGGNDEGKGAFSWELSQPNQDPPGGWVARTRDWEGGSCRSIAFREQEVLAATHHRGVLRLNSTRGDAAWTPPELDCGLQLRAAGEFLFLPIETVASDPQGRVVMAGTAEGIVSSTDGGVTYSTASARAFRDKVTLPPTWLFCSGDHEIEVVSEGAIRRD